LAAIKIGTTTCSVRTPSDATRSGPAWPGTVPVANPASTARVAARVASRSAAPAPVRTSRRPTRSNSGAPRRSSRSPRVRDTAAGVSAGGAPRHHRADLGDLDEGRQPVPDLPSHGVGQGQRRCGSGHTTTLPGHLQDSLTIEKDYLAFVESAEAPG
jgi:hypothetical protein